MPVHVIPFFVASNATEKVSIAFGYILSLYVPSSLVAGCFYQYFPPDRDAEGTNEVAMSVVNNCYTVQRALLVSIGICGN